MLLGQRHLWWRWSMPQTVCARRWQHCGTLIRRLFHLQALSGIPSTKFMTSFWLLVCFGVIGLPHHAAVRCISYCDSKVVHRGIILGTVVVGA
ncbi:MAG: hypothetical protein GPOALKHO_001824 [Sodalis sp.]|nr:MAG: hypothetical protein GPOALKHO_001824 [Sodalis sp.]